MSLHKHAVPVVDVAHTFQDFAAHVRTYLDVKTSVPVPTLHTPSGAGSFDAPLWIEEASRSCGFRSEQIALRAASIHDYLRTCGPTLLHVVEPGHAEPRWLFLLPRGGGFDALGHNGHSTYLTRASLEQAAHAPNRNQLEGELEGVLGRLSKEAQTRLLEGLLQRMQDLPSIVGVYSFRRIEAENLVAMPRTTRSTAVGLLIAYAVQFTIALTLWTFLFQSALRGLLERGAAMGAAILLLALQVVRSGSEHAVKQWGIQLGVLLRTTLLTRATLGKPDRYRKVGFSHLLAACIEAESLDERALELASWMSTAVLEVAFASVAIAYAEHRWLLCLLGGTAALALVQLTRTFPLGPWTKHRLELSSRLSEYLVGHVTEAVQARAETHDRSKAALQTYAEASVTLDHRVRNVRMFARAFRVVALALVLGFAFREQHLPLLSIVAALILGRAVHSVSALISPYWLLRSSLSEVMPLLESGSEPTRHFHPHFSAAEPSEALPLQSERLSFQHRSGRTILKDLDLRFEPGEKTILTGPSGCGKSTLLSLLAGIREPTGGAVSAGGLTPSFLGESAWRKRVVYVPQFHENHVFSESFAFNVLMGRRWPPTEQDLADAERVCGLLGLGPLLESMPGGLMQMVGESGWQLSHGERSRLYLARGLLQNPDYLLLDESFGALDPDTLRSCIENVREHSKGLIIVAHP